MGGALDKYLSDISKCGMITIAEEVNLAQRIREGDQVALEKLVLANLRFVVSVAKQYQNYGMTLTDLINEGNVGLIKAASRFDEKKGFKFISYAVWWIRQSIIQSIGDNSRMVRLPLNRLSAINKIRKQSGVLEQLLEREASVEEIAHSLELSVEAVEIAINISGKHVSSDAPIGDAENLSLMDVIIMPNGAQPDDGLMTASLNTEIARALATLTDREKDVVMLFYGIGQHHNFTLEEIGEKYDLTRERVRQIKEKAIRKLRHVNKNRALRAYLGN